MARNHRPFVTFLAGLTLVVVQRYISKNVASFSGAPSLGWVRLPAGCPMPSHSRDRFTGLPKGSTPVTTTARAALIYDATEEGIELMMRDADLGDIEAQYMLGEAFHEGDALKRNDARSASYLGMAAAQGHARAQHRLGMLYLNGYGVEENLVTSAAWISSAANQGLVEAQYQMAMMLLGGLGVEYNGEWALYWLREAAKQEGPKAAEAMYRLGVMYESGQEVDRDVVKAMQYYEQAFVNGKEEAALDSMRISRSGAGAGLTFDNRNTPGLPAAIRRELWGGKGW